MIHTKQQYMSEIKKVSVKEFVYILCEKNGLTFRDVANKMGITEQNFTVLLTPKNSIGIKKLNEIVFNITGHVSTINTVDGEFIIDTDLISEVKGYNLAGKKHRKNVAEKSSK